MGDLDDDDDGRGTAGDDIDGDADADNDDRETPAEKRVRLAKQYLETLSRPARRRRDGDAADDADDADDDAQDGDEDEDALDRDYVATRLLQDNMTAKGKLQVRVADQLPTAVDSTNAVSFRGHDLSVTCVVLAEDDRFVFSAGKEGSIIKWNLALNKKEWAIKANTTRNVPSSFQGHTDQVLALAATSDGKYLLAGRPVQASGGRDADVRIWDAAAGTPVHVFKQHRGAVTLRHGLDHGRQGLAFRRGTYQLYSASDDRTVKVWEVGELAYVETLFGHQEGVTSIDALSRERCLTSGGRDRTARLWKIPEESQLVYRGPAASMDTVRWLSDDCFVSGDDQGNLCLWDVNKKKATVTIPNAHGPGRWICSVAALPHTDLVASGSADGVVRFWKAGQTRRTLVPVATCSVPGFVNSMVFSTSGRILVVGLGQEHRLGRWERQADARNGVRVFTLPINRELASRTAVQAHKPSTVAGPRPNALAGILPLPSLPPKPEPKPAKPKLGHSHRGGRGGRGGGGKRPQGSQRRSQTNP